MAHLREQQLAINMKKIKFDQQDDKYFYIFVLAW